MHRPGSNPAKCGKVRRTGDVQIRIEGKSAWYHGLVNCGQVWACSVCAYRIAVQRAKELQTVIEGHRKAGGAIYLVTATIPHDQGDRLKPMRRAVSKAWRKTTSGRAWQDMKDRIEWQGQVRALEVMHGVNGWHPHLHILLFTRRSLSEAETSALSNFLYQRWSDAIEAAGYRRPSPEHGLWLSHGEDAGWYVTKITKQGLAQEIGRPDTKKGRAGSRSILQIIDDWSQYGRDSDKRLIREWLDGMYGARQLTWSRGIRKRYLPPEQLDFELVQDAEKPAGELVCKIDGHCWDCAIEFDPSLSWRLLEAAEKYGRDGVEDLIDSTCLQIPP